MKNLSSYLILSKDIFTFNSDILETNLINIILLIVIIVFVAKTPFKLMLETRYKEIVENVEGGEQKLIEANQRLIDAKLQWSQAHIVLEELKIKTNQNNLELINKEFKKGNTELSQLFENAIPLILYREQSVFNGLIKQLTSLVLEKLIMTLKTDKSLNQSIIIDNTIKKLDNTINKLGG
jgi:F-type H+-transporting ATPase subunit b